jgi:hypothetical protein
MNEFNGLNGLMEEPKTQNHKEPLNEVKWSEIKLKFKFKWNEVNIFAFKAKVEWGLQKSLNFE